MPKPVDDPNPKAPRRKRRPTQAELTTEEAPQFGGAPGIKPPAAKTEPLSMLVVYPDREWQVMAGEVVPVVSTLALVSGVNNVEYSEASKTWDITRAKASIEARGGLVLPFTVDGKSYVKRIKNHGGYIFRWQKVYSGSAQIDTDEKAFAAWLRGLVQRGVIADPPSYALEALLGKLRVRKASLQAAGKDKYESKIDHVVESIRAVEIELERVQRLVEVEADEEDPEVAFGDSEA